MTAVRIGTLLQAGEVTDRSDIRPPGSDGNHVPTSDSSSSSGLSHPLSVNPSHPSYSIVYLADVSETTRVGILPLLRL
jgi:hypothetical protein